MRRPKPETLQIPLLPPNWWDVTKFDIVKNTAHLSPINIGNSLELRKSLSLILALFDYLVLVLLCIIYHSCNKISTRIISQIMIKSTYQLAGGDNIGG